MLLWHDVYRVFAKEGNTINRFAFQHTHHVSRKESGAGCVELTNQIEQAIGVKIFSGAESQTVFIASVAKREGSLVDSSDRIECSIGQNCDGSLSRAAWVDTIGEA